MMRYNGIFGQESSKTASVSDGLSVAAPATASQIPGLNLQRFPTVQQMSPPGGGLTPYPVGGGVQDDQEWGENVNPELICAQQGMVFDPVSGQCVMPDPTGGDMTQPQTEGWWSSQSTGVKVGLVAGGLALVGGAIYLATR